MTGYTGVACALPRVVRATASGFLGSEALEYFIENFILKNMKYQKQAGLICECGRPAASKGKCRNCYQSQWYSGKKTTCQHEGCSKGTTQTYCATHRDRRPKCSNEFCRRKANEGETLCPHHLARKDKPFIKHGPEHRLRMRAQRTGVSVDHILRCRRKQGGKCGICPATMEADSNHGHSECIDHCHTTGEARGLLCRACNLALGLYEKSQRPAGLRIEAYETYLDRPPFRRPLPPPVRLKEAR